MVFFFAGHGSQAINSRSREPDGRDETLVPADSMAGAADLRNQELRRLFNRVLDRGGRLTVILDSCHSGSALRGLPPRLVARFLPPDPLDIADGSALEPAPEDLGALVLSAAQDFEPAWETVDGEGRTRGAFSLALGETLAAAGPGEPVEWIFQRAKAQLQTAAARQEPVLAGPRERRSAPLFGAPGVVPEAVVAVARVRDDGTALLQGGWVHGLTVGSELEPVATGGVGAIRPRLRVTAVLGPATAEAVVAPAEPQNSQAVAALRPGDLFWLSSWTVSSEPWLRVWIPQEGPEWQRLVAFARRLRERAAGPAPPWTWVEDPLAVAPTHLLTWEDDSWVLTEHNGSSRPLGRDLEVARLARELAGAAPTPALFVHLPAPSRVATALDLGAGRQHDALARTSGPAGADYHLVVRLAGAGVEAAWVHPAVGHGDEERTALPLRSDWLPLRETAPSSPGELLRLQQAALRLARIRAWLALESPPGADFSYSLTLRRSDGLVLTEGTLAEKKTYELLLQGHNGQATATVLPRYLYAFSLDSFGRSTLLFPPDARGNVENHLPLEASPPAKIPLGPQPLFVVAPPFGVDTYFLLASDEVVPVPRVLAGGGVWTRSPCGASALEELLCRRGATTRGPGSISTPRNWSLERRSFRSVPAP